MYHIHTNESEYTDRMYQYIQTKSFSAANSSDPTQLAHLRSIADLSFDMLGQVQKMEKLHKLNHLSVAENKEYVSIIRLVGTMIFILRQYNYSDFEMMDALVKRFQRYQNFSQSAAA